MQVNLLGLLRKVLMKINYHLKILVYGLTYNSFIDFFHSYFNRVFYTFKGNREPGVENIIINITVKNIEVPLMLFPIYNTPHSKVVMKDFIKKYSSNYNGILFYTNAVHMTSLEFSLEAISLQQKQKEIESILILDYPTDEFIVDLRYSKLVKQLEQLSKSLFIPVKKICWKSMNNLCEVCDGFFYKCFAKIN